ncbi:hypothetical protein [Peribacillus tepidiphilus]|uniref:hypothetical protein n=1 Tax=Peribacillus tepidiphilus TaxID=2652445 RepID=UPI0035B4FDFE
MKHHLKFEGQVYSTVLEMAEFLLNQANEKIIRIDLGEFPNNVEERNYIKFRLMHLQRVFSDSVPAEILSIYNSVWSQLYRLEHQCQYVHPYLAKVMEYIKNGQRHSN